MLGEQPAPARLADLVAGPADALEAAGHRARRLDLDHEVDRAHVDAELERRRGHEPLQPARLELVLDHQPPLARQRAVVGLHQLDGRRRAESLCADERGLLGRDERRLLPISRSAASSLSRVASRSARRRALTKISVERCSCTRSSRRGCIAGQMLRRTGPAAAGPLVGSSITWPSSAMSSTGTTTSISSGLRMPASTMVTGRGRRRAGPAGSSSKPPRKRAISSSGRWVADRPMRCGGRSQRASSRSSVSARCGPALGGGQRVDLVDDHRLDVAQGVPGLRREHQVERLGRGDQQVGRVADELAALVLAACRRCGCRRSARGAARPRRSAARPMPRSGARRFLSTSTASARSGEM